MNIIQHLQTLDDLIGKNTQPPVTAILRNRLSLTIEQCEAYQASSDKQDQTLATQVETIERITREKQQVDAELASLKLKKPRPTQDRAIDDYNYI